MGTDRGFRDQSRVCWGRVSLNKDMCLARAAAASGAGRRQGTNITLATKAQDKHAGNIGTGAHCKLMAGLRDMGQDESSSTSVCGRTGTRKGLPEGFVFRQQEIQDVEARGEPEDMAQTQAQAPTLDCQYHHVAWKGSHMSSRA